jgi:hypothetical protein
VVDEPERELGSRSEPEFGQAVAHVDLDGSLVDNELLGDLTVRKTARHELRDLALASRQTMGAAGVGYGYGRHPGDRVRSEGRRAASKIDGRENPGRSVRMIYLAGQVGECR